MVPIEGEITIARPPEAVFDFVADERNEPRVNPVPGGTRMRWQWELAPRGLLRLLTPLVVRVGRRQEEAIWAGLKRCLEEQEARRAW